MIGYVRFVDIPKIIIGVVIGMCLAIPFIWLAERFHWMESDSSEWIFFAAMLAILIFSIWASERIWNWIDDRF